MSEYEHCIGVPVLDRSGVILADLAYMDAAHEGLTAHACTLHAIAAYLHARDHGHEPISLSHQREVLADFDQHRKQER